MSVKNQIWSGHDIDFDRYLKGNIFRTKQDADYMLYKMDKIFNGND